MDMTGTQRIEAPREVVWAALNDPDVLKQCIPGCQSMERVGDNGFAAKAVLKIGPVKASFSGNVTLSDIDPPNGYTISGEGNGGVAGMAKGGATVKLASESDDVTILTYDVKSQISGKIAQLGSRLIDATAKKLAGEFFESFGKVVAPPPPGTEMPEEKKKWWKFGKKG
ncbi:MAG: carbon monoxide dehydrogenase subunit G [Proteobacteria bacterium]|nr:carbon monoxide dehydrogenase subunit G [Pseudomonadota bacterium]